jgi:hypothetical protein
MSVALSCFGCYPELYCNVSHGISHGEDHGGETGSDSG